MRTAQVEVEPDDHQKLGVSSSIAAGIDCGLSYCTKDYLDSRWKRFALKDRINLIEDVTRIRDHEMADQSRINAYDQLSVIVTFHIDFNEDWTTGCHVSQVCGS